ncbi:MAG: polysaccharide biosynthesis/export family protein [Cecembia sp.]
MMKNYILILSFSILSFSSCKTINLFSEKPSRESFEEIHPVFYSEKANQYHIRKDDKITISIWGQDDLSVGSTYGIYNSNEVYGKWLMVDADGNIEVPKIGTLQVEKMTIIELKERIKELFSEWIKNPVVDIKVLNREITVIGEVGSPQVINVDKEKNTLLELIAQSQGFDFYANLKRILVLRQVGEDVYVAQINLTERGNYLSKNIPLYPGDIVIVPSKKNKEFDRRISTIIPFATTVTAASILMGAL